MRSGTLFNLLYFVLLPFTDNAFFFFNKLRVCGNPVLNKTPGALFPLAHFVSLLLYLLWLSAISDHSLKAQMMVNIF